jgi:hypothetical protein
MWPTKHAKAGAFAYDVLRWEWRVFERTSSIGLTN